MKSLVDPHRIELGDLVRDKHTGSANEVGIVVKKSLPSESLGVSEHVRHIIGAYPKSFYVFFPSRGVVGPMNENDLRLDVSNDF